MSYVYVIHGAHGMVKIGHSVDPPSRVNELQTGSPYRLRLDYSLYIGPAAEAVEDEAHAILDRHRGIGEWFDVPSDIAVAAIGAAAFRIRAIRQAKAEREPWKERFFILSAALTPSWLLHTPTLFCVVMFVFVVYATLVIPFCHGSRFLQIIRWAGTVIGAMFLSVTVASILTTAAKAAEPIPVYNVVNYCSSVSDFAGGNDILRSACVELENDNKIKIRRLWNETPEAIKASCVKTIKVGSPGSYQVLGACLAIGMGNQWYEGKLRLQP